MTYEVLGLDYDVSEERSFWAYESRLERQKKKWIRFRDPFHAALFHLSISIPYHLFIYILTYPYISIFLLREPKKDHPNGKPLLLLPNSKLNSLSLSKGCLIIYHNHVRT